MIHRTPFGIPKGARMCTGQRFLALLTEPQLQRDTQISCRIPASTRDAIKYTDPKMVPFPAGPPRTICPSRPGRTPAGGTTTRTRSRSAGTASCLHARRSVTVTTTVPRSRGSSELRRGACAARRGPRGQAGELLTLLGRAARARPRSSKSSLDSRSLTAWRHAWRARHHHPSAQQAQHRNGVPELRVVSPHDGRGEHRFPLSIRKISKRRQRVTSKRRWYSSAWPGMATVSKAVVRGQQQRVALARAVVFKPRLLLLDERSVRSIASFASRCSSRSGGCNSALASQRSS